MRFKPVPEPPDDLAAVEPILAAVPETAGVVDDCCQHLIEETRLEARDEAETWLPFLRALSLATETSAGYRRTVTEPSSGDALASEERQRAFHDRVYGAAAILEALGRADEPQSVTDVTDAVCDDHPAFEREQPSKRLASAGSERVRRLLEWAVLLELAERVDGGDQYRRSADLADRF